MANISKALKILWQVEYNGKIEKALHINSHTERVYTYKGIYKGANPKWLGWEVIDEEFAKNNNDYIKTSIELEKNSNLQMAVEAFYKNRFWDKAKLDDIESQITANEIFIFGVVAGMPLAIKAAQKIVKVKTDGIVGYYTIEALNNYNEEKFSVEYDLAEKEYFETLAAINDKYKIYLEGWKNRADVV